MSRDTGVSVEELTVTTGQRTLLRKANFALPLHNCVTGLVGRNGSGKTTLFDLIYRAWRRDSIPDHLGVSGRISIPKRVSIAYFPQAIQITFLGKVRDYLAEISPVAALVERFESYPKQRDNDLLEAMTKSNAWAFVKKRAGILKALSIEGIPNRDIGLVSGGEAARVALARILLSGSDILLLDEPTNNLDFRSVQFLIGWLKNWGGGALVVSHDRDFLDEVTNQILEIDESSLSVLSYGGNYSFYKQKKEEEFFARLREYDEEKKNRGRLLQEGLRLKASARAFEKVSRNAFQRARGAKVAKRAKAQLKRVERDFMQAQRLSKPKKPTLVVPIVSKEGEKELLVSARNLSFHYTGFTSYILSNVSLNIYHGDRIGIIGPNGSGKSTLLKMIAGNLEAENEKTIFRKPNLNVGFLEQHLGRLVSFYGDIFEFVKESGVEMPREQVRKSLGNLLFRNVNDSNLRSFSLGELQRIQLFVMLAKNPDMVVLDEPTNHLDVYTTELLEEALREFGGAVVVVSHERRFLKNMAVRSLYVLAEGKTPTDLPVDKASDIDSAFTLHL